VNKSLASAAGSALAYRKAQKQTKEERAAGARKAANARWRAVREKKRLAAARSRLEGELAEQ
jgi:hypothetical protein